LLWNRYSVIWQLTDWIWRESEGVGNSTRPQAGSERSLKPTLFIRSSAFLLGAELRWNFFGYRAFSLRATEVFSLLVDPASINGEALAGDVFAVV
jgi:hypothetical protein